MAVLFISRPSPGMILPGTAIADLYYIPMAPGPSGAASPTRPSRSRNVKYQLMSNTKKGNYPMIPNPYLYEKIAQAHYQELLHEAEQQRLLARVPRRHPHLMR